MACKYLTTTSKRQSPTVGGPAFPRHIEVPACRRRDRDLNMFIGGASRCKKTAEEGPCWLWAKLHGSEPDPAFQGDRGKVANAPER